MQLIVANLQYARNSLISTVCTAGEWRKNSFTNTETINHINQNEKKNPGLFFQNYCQWQRVEKWRKKNCRTEQIITTMVIKKMFQLHLFFRLAVIMRCAMLRHAILSTCAVCVCCSCRCSISECEKAAYSIHFWLTGGRKKSWKIQKKTHRLFIWFVFT